MTATITSIILAVVTALSGGVNILQLINNRQMRRKLAAEADTAETQSLRLIIEGNVQEIARLQARVDDYAQRYDDILDKYHKLMDEVNNLKNK